MNRRRPPLLLLVVVMLLATGVALTGAGLALDDAALPEPAATPTARVVTLRIRETVVVSLTPTTVPTLTEGEWEGTATARATTTPTIPPATRTVVIGTMTREERSATP